MKNIFLSIFSNTIKPRTKSTLLLKISIKTDSALVLSSFFYATDFTWRNLFVRGESPRECMRYLEIQFVFSKSYWKDIKCCGKAYEFYYEWLVTTDKMTSRLNAFILINLVKAISYCIFVLNVMILKWFGIIEFM